MHWMIPESVLSHFCYCLFLHSLFSCVLLVLLSRYNSLKVRQQAAHGKSEAQADGVLRKTAVDDRKPREGRESPEVHFVSLTCTYPCLPSLGNMGAIWVGCWDKLPMMQWQGGNLLTKVMCMNVISALEEPRSRCVLLALLCVLVSASFG